MRRQKKVKPWKIESAWCVAEDDKTPEVLMAYGQKAALAAYVERNLAEHRAFSGSRFEWSRGDGKWHEDDGCERHSREWRIVASFDHNGYERDHIVTAWNG